MTVLWGDWLGLALRAEAGQSNNEEMSLCLYYRRPLATAFHIIFFFVIWLGFTIPAACAHAHFIRKRRYRGSLLTGRIPPPAFILHLNTIRDGAYSRPSMYDRFVFVSRSIVVRSHMLEQGDPSRKSYFGKAVAPSAPREELGLYWGYQTRLASGLADVIAGCPFKGG